PSGTLAPKKWIGEDALNDMLNLLPHPHAQARLLGLVVKRRFPKLIASFCEKLVIHPFSFLSNSANTSRPGTPDVSPASYLLILTRISVSHAASASTFI